MTANPSSEWPRFSTYTPLFRRFDNGQDRDNREALALWDEMNALQRQRGLTVKDLTFRIAEPLRDYLRPDAPFGHEFMTALVHLVQAERYMFEMPKRSVEHLTLAEFAGFKNFLWRKQHYFQHQANYHELLEGAYGPLFYGLLSLLPEIEDPSPFTIPLINTLPQPRSAVNWVYEAIQNQAFIERGMFEELAAQLSRNLADASGVPYDDPKPRKPIKFPIQSDLPLDELQSTYLQGTVFEDLFSLPVPLQFTNEVRFHHMHVLGGTGAGKTALLENLILRDLKDPTRPSVVVIDSQGDLIRKLMRIDHRRDDMILVSPKDVSFPPALNVFDVNRDRLAEYDQATREQVMAGVIQTFDYLFTSLVGADLTAKQSVLFRHIARLMLSLPRTMGRNATILDMIRLMENPAPFADAIKSMPNIPRQFLEDALLKNAKGQDNKTFAQTRDQIKYRLHAIIENPTLARLFMSPNTKLDLFSELNQGSVILVDTAKDFLKDSSAAFGQIFISLVLQAILERAALPQNERRPTFLYVDEAAEYFDANIDDLLTESRKQKLGAVFAHQYLEQCSHGLRASLFANTSTKFAAGVSVADARVMAPELRTTPDFIMDQPRLHFAAHIRSVTPAAVSIPVQVGVLDRELCLSPDEFEDFIAQNRDRVAYEPVDEEQGAPVLSPRREGDVSDDWDKV